MEEELKGMQFDLSDPIVVVFDVCEDLQEISEAADNNFLDKEILQKGLQIIRNKKDFIMGLEDWDPPP